MTDITKCKDCNGIYDPCNHHLARIHELGVGQWEVTGNISKQDVPRDTRYYTLTDHAQSRMGLRHLNKKIAHYVIENGEIERAAGENTFRFTSQIDGQGGRSGQCVVIVSVSNDNLTKGRSNPIITIYMNGEN